MNGGSKARNPIKEVWINVYSDYSLSSFYNNKYNAKYLVDNSKILIYRLHVRLK